MRGLVAEDVVELAVERHHPSLLLACSFQKEESVLIDMLLSIEPTARVFTIDTGVLFPETYETWRKIEDRYGLRVEAPSRANLSQEAEPIVGIQVRRIPPRRREG